MTTGSVFLETTLQLVAVGEAIENVHEPSPFRERAGKSVRFTQVAEKDEKPAHTGRGARHCGNRPGVLNTPC
jgi:hypothetical protein